MTLPLAAGARLRNEARRLVYCDTMPDSLTNIWHFPEEWRAMPETRRVSPNRAVSFVTAGELLAVTR